MVNGRIGEEIRERRGRKEENHERGRKGRERDGRKAKK